VTRCSPATVNLDRGRHPRHGIAAFVPLRAADPALPPSSGDEEFWRGVRVSNAHVSMDNLLSNERWLQHVTRPGREGQAQPRLRGRRPGAELTYIAALKPAMAPIGHQARN
jgi:hypothetical protein